MSNSTSAGDLYCAQSLPAMGLFDTRHDPRFERLARIAAATLRMPMAVLWLADADGVRLHAGSALGARETAALGELCRHAIDAARVTVVTDTLADARCADSAAVSGAPHTRFLASAPVHGVDGQRLGALCVMDRVPRLFGDEEHALLLDVAGLIEDELQRADMVKALEQKQELLDAVLETVDVGVIACSADGALTVFNRAARELHGIEDIIDAPNDWARAYNLFGADGVGLAEHRLPLRRALQGEQVRDIALSIRPEGAAPRTVLASGRRLCNSAGEPLGAVAALKDVTELAASRSRAAESEERLRTIADNLPALVAYVDIDMRYRFANQRYRDWLGVQVADMVGKTVEEALGPEFFAARAESLRNCLNGHAAHVEVEQVRGRHSRVISSTYLPHIRDGQVLGMYVLSTDSTAARRHERYLVELAHTDPLTGLPNRRSYEQNLAVAASRAKRLGLPMAVAYLDLDNFKQINDTFGHDGGDTVLQEISTRLLAAVRSTDIVSRLAGDEFTVILENVTSADECHVVGQKILDAVHQPIHIQTKLAPVTVSVGFAWSREADVSYLTRRADNALYKAKASGRDTVVVDAI